VKYATNGINTRFVQDNHSRPRRGTLRGLHAQRTRPQAKLVRAVEGTIFNVVVDFRRGSPTYLKWLSVELSADNFRQIYIPVGYAHGICVLSDFAEIEHKCTDFYDSGDEMRILWNDPQIAIVWAIVNPVLSPRDRTALHSPNRSIVSPYGEWTEQQGCTSDILRALTFASFFTQNILVAFNQRRIEELLRLQPSLGGRRAKHRSSLARSRLR
jgi:dTDP-4-dehydrorhamnose 3,5-epimerase